MKLQFSRKICKASANSTSDIDNNADDGILAVFCNLRMDISLKKHVISREKKFGCRQNGARVKERLKNGFCKSQRRDARSVAQWSNSSQQLFSLLSLET